MSAAPKFTPGPWRIGHDANAADRGAFRIVDARSDNVATASFRFDRALPPMDRNETAAEYAARARDNSERGANARLIAAAPDLYVAAERLLRDLDRPTFRMDKGAEDALRAALAKARGES